jgi:hypothetical protein
VAAAGVSLYAYLLAVRDGGLAKARPDKRFMAGLEADTAMPPVGRLWIRPRAVRFVILQKIHYLRFLEIGKSYEKNYTYLRDPAGIIRVNHRDTLFGG